MRTPTFPVGTILTHKASGERVIVSRVTKGTESDPLSDHYEISAGVNATETIDASRLSALYDSRGRSVDEREFDAAVREMHATNKRAIDAEEKLAILTKQQNAPVAASHANKGRSSK